MPVAIPRLPASIAQRPPPQQERGTPVILFAEASINPGEFATLNADALRNNTASYIEIHEMRIAGRTDKTDPSDQFNLGAMFADVDLKVGKMKVTNNPIPTALFERSEGMGWNSAGYFGNVGYVRIRFARPIRLAPGAMIEPTIYHKSTIAQKLRARVAFAGRALNVKPADRAWLPYIASFSKTVVPSEFDVTAVVSSEKDLVNMAPTAVRVERITGRFMTFKTTATVSYGNIAVMSDPVFSNNNGASNGGAYLDTKLRLTDARGFNYANLAGFPAVFDPARRGWECRFNLPPGGYLLTETMIAPMSGVDFAQIGFGLIGYREI